MNCPNCQQKLDRTQYAGANVHRCTNCHGHLVDKRRVKTIEKRVDKDLNLLKNKVEQANNNDTQEHIRCPRCKARMKKNSPKDLGFNIDECLNCDATWFDVGELADDNQRFVAEVESVEI